MEQTNANTRNYFWFLFAAVLYFSVYGFNLQYPPEMYYDEVYFVKTAQQITVLNGYTDTVQPPLGKLLIALCIMIGGNFSWVWRLVPLVTGFGCLVMIYEITKLLTQKSKVAFLAACLFSLDGVSFTQARIGILNAPMLFFMLLSVWSLTKHAVAREWPRRVAFSLSGIFFGLAVATRLIGLSVVPLLFIFYWKIWQEEKEKGALIKDTLYYLVFLPVVLYESTYLIIPFIHGLNWFTIWKMQVNMIHYHLTLKKGHLYGSPWWSWPLMIRPIWYYFKQIPLNGVAMVKGILCIGNPFIFWVTPFVMIFALVQLFRSKGWVYPFVVIGYFTQWLQWAPVTRVKFFHYIYTAMPFAAIALALVLESYWRLGRFGKGLVVFYLVLVIAMFFYWYPLLNGMLIPDACFRQHMWFRCWI